MKIAITGATGHIGSCLCRRLSEAGHEVKALVRRDPPIPGLEGLPVNWIRGDVRDGEALQQLTKGVEVVYHLAAKISVQGDPDGSVWSINTEGPRNVVQACLSAGVRRLVHFSSVHAFDMKGAGAQLDESGPLVGNRGYAYDRSKAEGQRIVHAAAADLEVIVLNPTSVIGPPDIRPSLMGQTFLRLYHRQLPALVKGGFDFVDVRDVVDAAMVAMQGGLSGSAYLLSGQYCSIFDLAQLVQSITGKAAPKWVVEIGLAKLGVPFFALWSMLTGAHPLFTFESLAALEHGDCRVSNKRAAAALSFNARPLEETISDLYKWFEEHAMLKL